MAAVVGRVLFAVELPIAGREKRLLREHGREFAIT